MSEPEIEVKDDSLNPDDKTSKNEIKEEIDNLPDEDGEEEEKKDTEEKPKDDVDRSEVAQKIRWREKFQRERERRIALESKPASKPEESAEGDDKDAAAKRYIKDVVKQTIQETESERESREQRELEEFEDKVYEVLEDNPSLKEQELLTTIEEYDVNPEAAAKILIRFNEAKKDDKKEKPRMPTPRRASPSAPTEKPDDKGKSMYQIAQEVIKGITGK